LGGDSDAKHGEWRLRDGESDFLVCSKVVGNNFDCFFLKRDNVDGWSLERE
jgi:hypothetical protein